MTIPTFSNLNDDPIFLECDLGTLHTFHVGHGGLDDVVMHVHSADVRLFSDIVLAFLSNATEQITVLVFDGPSRW